MASLVGHRVAVWWESHKGKRPQPGGWLGTVHTFEFWKKPMITIVVGPLGK
jgi:hypothetical protein